MSALNQPYFHDETAAYRFVEAHVWPDGPVCPHCGATERISAMKGKSTRIGTYKCYHCRKPFTVKVGTVFESSHIKMHIWLQAIFLVASSKKGISSNQLARTLDVTVKTAWFMSHRIREAMRDGKLSPMGGEGQIVEADETYFGKRADPQPSSQRKCRSSKCVAPSTQTSSKAISASSNAGCAASTSTATRSACTSTSLSLISGPTIG